MTPHNRQPVIMSHWWNVFLLQILLLHVGDVRSLTMRNFYVPNHVVRGKQATLECEFDLEGERLYSVKWYKGGREFFRYVPNERPMKQKYSVQGVWIDMEASTGQKVVLKSVNLATSGRYRCEVLAEAPDFNTLVEQAILTVVDIPEEKPIVRGAQERYQPGDLVRINCTSASSKPAAKLTWFINDKKAPEQYVVRYPPIMHYDGLEQSTLGLNFKASHAHFPKGVMSVRCLASIGVLYHQHEEASLESHRPALSLQSSVHVFNSGDRLKCCHHAFFLSLVVCWGLLLAR